MRTPACRGQSLWFEGFPLFLSFSAAGTGKGTGSSFLLGSKEKPQNQALCPGCSERQRNPAESGLSREAFPSAGCTLGCKSFCFQAQHGFFSFAREISLFHFSALFSLQGRQAPLRRWRSPIRKKPPSESAGILNAQRVALSLGSQSNEGASEPRLCLVGGGNYRRGNMGRGKHTQCGA